MDACWETQLQSLPPADHSCCPLQKSSFSFVFSQQHVFFMHFMKHRHCIVVVGFFLMEILEIIKDSKTQCLETEKKNFSILQKSYWICMQLSELLVNGRISAVLQKQRRFDKKKKTSQRRPRSSYATMHFCFKDLTPFVKRNKQTVVAKKNFHIK